jgi:hypothetical protein
MKGLLLIVLLAAGIILLVYTGKTRSGKEAHEETYPEKLGHAMDKAEEADLEVRINNINACLNSYYTQNNEYPQSLDLLFPDFAPTQDSLNDPWGTRFKIQTDGEMNLNLISAGKDRVFGTSDDIKRRI